MRGARGWGSGSDCCCPGDDEGGGTAALDLDGDRWGRRKRQSWALLLRRWGS